jgi:hypothetical protein
MQRDNAGDRVTALSVPIWPAKLFANMIFLVLLRFRGALRFSVPQSHLKKTKKKQQKRANSGSEMEEELSVRPVSGSLEEVDFSWATCGPGPTRSVQYGD